MSPERAPGFKRSMAARRNLQSVTDGQEAVCPQCNRAVHSSESKVLADPLSRIGRGTRDDPFVYINMGFPRVFHRRHAPRDDPNWHVIQPPP